MATQSKSSTRLAFGPFEVNAAADELLKGGARTRLRGQPLQILLVLLEHSGELVTREQLREHIWPEGTFVDFEHGLNAAMNKLRRTLGDSAENPRYIETHPGRGYRFIGTIQNGTIQNAGAIELATPQMPVAVEALPAVPAGRPTRIWWWLVGGAACLLSFAVGRRFHESPAAAPPWKLRQLTADPGFSDSPALSPDGKVLAYSSDHGPGGGRDLYVKQVSGGQPIQLTSDGAGNTTPDFSPDGSRIVFHSDREGGGIYEIPAFGGEVRLLAKSGVNPRFSPDGSEVAYWIGHGGIVVTAPGAGEVWVVPVAGGELRRIGAQFTNARYPIWSPQGNQLLLEGYTASKNTDTSALDWWIVSTTNGQAFRTGIGNALIHAGLQYQSSGNPAPGSGLRTLDPWTGPTGRRMAIFSISRRRAMDMIASGRSGWTTSHTALLATPSPYSIFMGTPCTPPTVGQWAPGASSYRSSMELTTSG